MAGDRVAAWRRALAGLGLLALVVAAWFPGLLRGEVLSATDALYAHPPWEAQRPLGYHGPANKLLFDQVAQVYPWADYERRRLRAGEWPLWNPHAACGTSFFANQNAAVLHPLNLALLPLAPDTATGLTWIALARLALALAGAHALARGLGASPGASRLAALTYGLSGPILVWLGHPNTSASPLLPWSLLAAERLVAGPAGRRLAWTAALGGITAFHFLGGHPETSLHIGAFTGLYALLRAAAADRRRVLRPVGLTALGLALGFAAAGVQIVPFLSSLARSYPRELRLNHPVETRIPPTALPLAWAPRLYGTPQTLDHREDLARGVNFAECALFAGVLPLVLVPAAWPAIRRRPGAGAMAALGVIGLVVSIDPGGLATLLLRPLPLVGLGAHHRLVLFWTLALGVLLALALDALGDGQPPGRRALGAAAALGVLATGWGAVLAHAGGALGRAAALGALAALALIAAGVALALAARRLGRRRLIALALPLAFADLWLFGRGFNPTVPRDRVFPPTPALSRLQGEPGRVLGLTRVLPANTASVYGLDDAHGYEPLFSAHFQHWWWGAMTARGAWEQVDPAALRSPEGLRLIGVSHLLWGPGHSDLPIPGLAIERVHAGDATVFAVDRPMPRAFVVHAYELEPDAGRAGARLAAGYPYRSAVLLDRPPEPAPEPDPLDPGLLAPPVSYRRETPERMAIAAELRAPGVLVVSEGHDPGWRATVDGRPAPVLRAHGAFLAVALPAGTSRVLLSYRPAGLSAGLGLSAISLVGLGLIAAAGRRRSEPHP